LAIGVVLAVVGGSQINHLSDFINRIGSSSLTFSELLSHIFFIGDYDTTRINPVIWSLVHEMRISLIFPFLMLLVIRLDFKKNLLVALGSSLIVFLCVRTFGHSLTGILNTVHYASFFIVGALIARYRVSTVAKIRDLSSLCKYLLLVIAILAYTYSWNLYGIEIIHLYVIDDWAIAFGSVIFILLSLSSKRISALLNWRPILFTGKISYSLYLCHIIVLLSMVHTFNAYLSTWLILVMALILSYILAAFLYYKVELPSINLGRKLTQPFYYKQQAKM
jgi:peptidoglycan/LPS O-acetylase OafA/YrhL